MLSISSIDSTCTCGKHSRLWLSTKLSTIKHTWVQTSLCSIHSSWMAPGAWGPRLLHLQS
jgi:hypothetical protein